MAPDTIENDLKLDREGEASALRAAPGPERPPPSTVPRGSPVFDVRALVGEGREAAILHGGEVYRLRITSRDRLILTK